MSVKSREIVLSVVIPRLLSEHADGIVSRGEVMAELSRAGVPDQPWVYANKAPNRRGYYDVSSFADERNGVSEIRAEVAEDKRTPDEVERDVEDRFAVLDRMASGLADGKFRAVFISGPPGVGKTWTAEKILNEAKDVTYEKITGYSRATGLYKLLYENREANQIVLLDDCDSIFSDETALNLLKAACDTTARRSLHWRSEKEFEDGFGEEIPKHFEYNGRIVFVTNLDFDSISQGGGRMAPHLSAMMSRSFYLDLNLSHREILTRVLAVAKKSAILASHNAKEKERIVSFVKEHAETLREVSLRVLVKLSQILTATKTDADFLRIAKATLLRRA